VSCSGGSSSNWEVQLGLPFEGSVTPVSADVSADLKRADAVSVSVDGWAMDELKEGPYETMIRSNDALQDEFVQADRVIVENAVRIAGLAAFGRLNGQAKEVSFASAKTAPRLLDERAMALSDMTIRNAAVQSIQEAAVSAHPQEVAVVPPIADAIAVKRSVPNITVTDGVVALKGTVKDEATRTNFARAMAKTPGVRGVTNGLILADRPDAQAH
jgi:hypothetical protein